MTIIQFKIHHIEEMQQFAFDIAQFAFPTQVIALNGDLGAGKTTFTKGIGQALQVGRVINSPTFTIMKVYDAHQPIHGIHQLYHLDVYRLSDSTTDFELEEYFYQQGLTVIEWANIIEDLLPEETWYINIYRLSDCERIVECKNMDESLMKYLGAHYEIINR